MRCYLLTVLDSSQVPHDGISAMVVRAVSPKRARAFAAAHCLEEGSDVWLDQDKSSCKYLRHAGREEEVIIRDVNWG